MALNDTVTACLHFINVSCALVFIAGGIHSLKEMLGLYLKQFECCRHIFVFTFLTKTEGHKLTLFTRTIYNLFFVTFLIIKV